MPLVEKRYAEALIDVALGTGNLDIFQQELQFIADTINQQKEFKYFLLNPEVKTDNKKDVIKKVFAGSIKNELVNFLLLLLDKARIGNLQGICREYVQQADKIKNVLYITIVSAIPLDQSQVEAIKNKYGSLYHSTAVKASVELDRDLIGGVKVKIGDKVIDGSIKGRLESLKQLIIDS